MSVQRSQASVVRGKKAAYVVGVSTENDGTASGVSVALTAQPSSLKPAFTSGCAKGDGTAACTVSSVSAKQPASLPAQVPVASGAKSVTSMTLTATVSIVTSATWTAPSAAETVTVTAAPAAAKSAKSSASSETAAGAALGTTLPLGPVPQLNGVSSSLIGAGSAASLFPLVTPSATPSPSAEVHPRPAQRNAAPVAESSAIGFGRPALTGQVAGLVALALAVFFTVTRLSLRRRFRFRSGKHGS